MEPDEPSEDQEVLSINKRANEEVKEQQGSGMPGRSESQSADLFKELQREVSVCFLVLSVSFLVLLDLQASTR